MSSVQDHDSSGILASLSPEEMRQYLASLIETNEDARRHLMATFPAKSGLTVADLKAIVASSLKPLAYQRGFVHPSVAMAALGPVSQLVDTASRSLLNEDLKGAITICQAVIERLVPAFQTIDDSNGILSGLVDSAFDILETVPLHNPPEAIRSGLFAYCVSNATRKVYDGWDAEWRFANLAADLAAPDEERTLVKLTIAMRKRDTGSEWIEQHTAEHAAQVLLRFFMRTSSTEFIRQFIEENLRFPSIRMTAIASAMRNKEFDKAISLTEEGIRLSGEQRLPGLVSQFNEQLLTIYREQGNKADAVRMAEILFKESRHTLKYFEVLKEMMELEEWVERRPEFLEKIRKEGDMRSLAVIYAADRDFPSLMTALEQYGRLELLEGYESVLLSEYRTRLQQLYFRIIILDLDLRPKRSTYRFNAKVLAGMLKKYDNDTVRRFAGELREKFNGRPAFLEELRRVGM